MVYRIGELPPNTLCVNNTPVTIFDMQTPKLDIRGWEEIITKAE